MKLAAKKISILGAVRSGIAAAKLAKKHGAIPFVSDFSDNEILRNNVLILNSINIKYELGNHSEKVYDADLIITSPGVPTDSKVLVEAAQRKITVISELEFASYFCKGKVVGITGTNGKTTTTTLLSHLLNNSGIKTYSAGNIGTAFSDIADQVKENEIVSLEISSFQLDFIKNFKPEFAVVLNLTPDHLNRYENSFEKYVDAKMKIAINQTSSEYFIGNFDDKLLTEKANYSSADKYWFSTRSEIVRGTFVKGEWIVFKKKNEVEHICKIENLSLRGEHNLSNALAVVTVAKLLGINNDNIAKSLSTFSGVEHRLELVREIDGVKYINDSKATNVDAVRFALNSFTEPVFLILGGKDKGNDYSQILDPVKSTVKKIYAIGVSAQKVYDFFNEFVDVEIKKSLKDAIVAGKNEALANDVILLSPACASFDMFDNYEHRGQVFKQIVNKL